MAYLYTKTGDSGKTGLFGGARVSKNSARVECYGTIDEANSMLGMAYSLSTDEFVKESINSIQKKLFILGAEIASDEDGAQKLSHRISDEDISALENIINTCEKVNGPQTEFVVPGKNQVSSALHVARTFIRRAERCMVNLYESEGLSTVLLKYTNRVSDTIYALARYEETNLEKNEIREKVTKIVAEKLKSLYNRNEITLETAREMARYAEEKAKELNVPIIFSVVDSGSNLLLLHRMDNAILGSIDISINKAYTANAFKMPTHELAGLSVPGASLYGIQNTNSGKVVVFGGGFPVVSNGVVIGAVGVSGGSVEEDMAIAKSALEHF